MLCALVCRGERPLDESEDVVSNELGPWSLCGIEGMTSAGASRPFLVVVPVVDREPNEKRPFAFGAEATRRMNRVALAPKTFGDKGPERDAEGGVVGLNDICEALAVCGVRGL